jgi:hypothetical protein
VSTQGIEQEIQDLDREAREALDKLADKREELERQHRATELADERQREREAERKTEEEREASEREHRKAVEEAGKLGRERLALEERAEREAKALAATMGELLELDPRHRRSVEAAWGKAPEQLYSLSFPRVLGSWFRGRFEGVAPGIGHDLHEGEGLPARDTLTPEAAPKAASADG